MTYDYNSRAPEFISVDKLSERERHLLMESGTFCMLPWTHLHAFPTGQAYPCCLAEMQHPIGNLREQTIYEVWNGEKMRQLRTEMLTEVKSAPCRKCYEQEDAGFFSNRNSSNKRFGHHIDRVSATQPNGTVEKMTLSYWDIRFSNLCNLRCRSCGHIFSSNWYDDQLKLIEMEGGNVEGYKQQNKRIEYAGRTQMDVWEQLEPHIEHVEHIYFAGGEPLIMEEHYRILNALIKLGKTDVRLIYNTNFTELGYKKQSVLDLWNQFSNVCVGASLDAMGSLAELMRKGTVWAQIERNREQMLKTCPQVDFYISPALSIMNVHQLPSFHRDWVDRGFIKHQDLNVNIVQDPAHYRIDIMTPSMKDKIEQQYLAHIEWVQPYDHLRRATVGFESAIKFMRGDDKTHLIPKFWTKTKTMDTIRNEDLLAVIPELAGLV
jgi:radical SAM protein with 4Fe4S-binding SPASM domain